MQWSLTKSSIIFDSSRNSFSLKGSPLRQKRIASIIFLYSVRAKLALSIFLLYFFALATILTIIPNAVREANTKGFKVIPLATEVLDRAKWDTLRNTYKLSILKLIYKIYHNDSPSCMARLVTKFQHSYNFRKKHLLIPPSFNTNSMKLSTSYRGAVLWNLLPRECHQAISLRSFMKMMNTSNIIKNTDFNNLYCKSS